MIGRFLEDFAVGQTFRSGRVRIDTERIKTFGAEFDPQPFHLDEEAARATIFGGLAASGWHTAAITMRLLVESDLASWAPAPTSSSMNRRRRLNTELDIRNTRHNNKDARCICPKSR